MQRADLRASRRSGDVLSMTTIELSMTSRASAVFVGIARKRGALWLDDASFVEPTFMGCRPVAQLIVRSDGAALRHERGVATPVGSDPIREIVRFLEETPAGALPWTVGFLSYDLAPFVEPRMRLARASGDSPLAYLARYDALLVGRPSVDRDDAAHDPPLRWRIQAQDEAAAERLVAELSDLEDVDAGPPIPPRGTLLEAPDRARHERAILRALDLIAAGDIYQVNLAGRFRVATQLTPDRAYLAMRSLQPVPHGAFLDTGELAVLVNSPERFLRVAADRVETQPIKGTRPRGSTRAADRELARDLLRDEKERAEHVMIVDLERNDLGRVCTPGSIAVESFLEVETYATLHHLVSTVRGRLRPDAGLEQLLRATFPGGSITGCPKIRAVEVIADLEEHPRGLYTGAFVRCRGPRDLDSAIAIRVAVARDGIYTYHAGGGIVADSDPAREYEECLLKAVPFLGATLGASSLPAERDGGDAWPAAR
jgi:para-aminobenzoate synthetase component I